ncbi:MAG: hypothetical protein DRO87_03680 [Candidatus Thorarchaeota archaeon]|nr:MAG: hypothetical protein DRP09_01230 [Candidatus Thorarchaeota archaeon]RLI59171.1 MAG: hypothetical protein DRO87_03680 [Candidatus Thorarchaeota archaeon]
MNGEVEMRILVIGSCGKKKQTQSPDEPSCTDLTSPDSLEVWQKRLSSLTVRAREMYTGNQSRELTRGVDLLRKIDGVHVTYVIISAGFGLVAEDEMVPPYDCSFSGMKKMYILHRSRQLGIGKRVVTISQQGFDLAYLALGKNYLTALGSGWEKNILNTIVAFEKGLIGSKYAIIPSGNKAVKSFSNSGYKIHGAAGFKGDLLRILAEHALSSDDSYGEVLSWKEPSHLRNLIFSMGHL